MAKKDKRFLETYVQAGGFSGPDLKILVDRTTGVNYLYLQNGNQGAAITPLLKQDGTPVVTAVSNIRDE